MISEPVASQLHFRLLASYWDRQWAGGMRKQLVMIASKVVFTLSLGLRTVSLTMLENEEHVITNHGNRTSSYVFLACLNRWKFTIVLLETHWRPSTLIQSLWVGHSICECPQPLLHFWADRANMAEHVASPTFQTGGTFDRQTYVYRLNDGKECSVFTRFIYGFWSRW